MRSLSQFQKALDYLEEHIKEKTDYETLAKITGSSVYNFMRVFTALSGYTPAEYVRARRLTLAGREIVSTNKKIIDVAFDYGYETPEAFTKAFRQFHGESPMNIRKSCGSLKTISALKLSVTLTGGDIMEYTLKKDYRATFVGIKTRFNGNASKREHLDEQFWRSTRNEQYVLMALRGDGDRDWYEVIDNFDENGFDICIAVLFDKENPFIEIKNGKIILCDAEMISQKMRDDTECVYDWHPSADEVKEIFEKFELITAEGRYASLVSEKAEFSLDGMDGFRSRGFSEWLPSSDCEIDNRPEILKVHWDLNGNSERYVELLLPVSE